LHAGCGKESLSGLVISRGPKSCEKVEMYRRQCCRVPLPEIADAVKAVAKADELAMGAAEGDKNVAKAADAAKRAAVAHGYSLEEIRQLADCTKCGLVSRSGLPALLLRAGREGGRGGGGWRGERQPRWRARGLFAWRWDGCSSSLYFHHSFC